MDKYISFGEAWKYCASFASYWIWIGAFILALFVGLYVIERMATKANKSMDTVKLVWAIAFILLTLGAASKNPANVAANTTQEQAARGVYIGF